MLLYGADDDVCEWAGVQLFGDKTIFHPPAIGIGVISGEKLIAGIVYNNYRPGIVGSIEMSIASIDKKWCSRHNLKQLFSYPFAQLKLGRVETHCRAQDEGVMMFLERLGFAKEGVHRMAYHDGSNAISYAMLKSECRWLS